MSEEQEKLAKLGAEIIKKKAELRKEHSETTGVNDFSEYCFWLEDKVLEAREQRDERDAQWVEEIRKRTEANIEAARLAAALMELAARADAITHYPFGVMSDKTYLAFTVDMKALDTAIKVCRNGGSRAALDALLDRERRQAAAEALRTLADEYEDRSVPHGFEYVHVEDIRKRAAELEAGK